MVNDVYIQPFIIVFYTAYTGFP